MLTDVEKTIFETIRENIRSVPKGSVILRRSDSPPKRIPSISVWSHSFVSSEDAISSEGPTMGEVVRDEFSGDGKRVSFKLSTPPLRPLLSVEHPPDRLAREGENFRIQYGDGLLSFSEPPGQGIKNVIVQYYGAKKASEIRRLRINLQYFLDVWATDPVEESPIIDEIVSVLVKSREFFESNGIQIRLRGGQDLTQKDGVPEGMFCRRLEFKAETDLNIPMPISRIEKIEVKRTQPRRWLEESDGRSRQ